MHNHQRLALIGSYPIGRAPRGGVESANRALVELLLDHNPYLEVDVLTVGDNAFEEHDSGRLRIHGKLPRDYRLARFRGFPHERPVVENFIAQLKPDTIVHSTGPLSAMAMVAARRHGLPCVFTVHGVMEIEVFFDRTLSPLMQRLLAWRLKPLTRVAVRAAHQVTAISSYAASYLQGLGRQGTIPVIPNPLDQLFEGVDHPFHPDSANILFAGNIHPMKGVHVLLEALGQIRKRVPEVHLRIAGPVLNETYANELKEQIRRLGLEACVTWVGWLDHKSKLVEEMLHADVFVLPSYAENLPQALQEAGSLGLPFVASEVGGVQDFVPRGLEQVLLTEPGNVDQLASRLGNLLENTDHRASISNQLRAHVRHHFSNDHIASEMLNLYAQVLNPAPARTSVMSSAFKQTP
jgi:glycosyltransferase involved in cell wall biosynthesis